MRRAPPNLHRSHMMASAHPDNKQRSRLFFSRSQQRPAKGSDLAEVQKLARRRNGGRLISTRQLVWSQIAMQ